MASVYPSDAGKTLRVHYAYRSGMIYEVYFGTRIGILAHLFFLYGAEVLIGLAILTLAQRQHGAYRPRSSRRRRGF